MPKLSDIDFTIKYRPGRDLTGVEAKVAEMTDSEPYALATVELGTSGFERVFDPRDYAQKEQEVLDLAHAMANAAKAHDALVETLQACAERFREYEQSHLAKDTHDGRMKADRNADMAEMCEAALKLARGDQ